MGELINFEARRKSKIRAEQHLRTQTAINEILSGSSPGYGPVAQFSELYKMVENRIRFSKKQQKNYDALLASLEERFGDGMMDVLRSFDIAEARKNNETRR
jgi:hypothetical protein